MEKLGRILLLLLNICIDVFLIFLLLLLFMWGFFGISPKQSLQKGVVGIQHAWDSLWGIELKKESSLLSPEYQKRAHRRLYVTEPSKRDKSTDNIINQPYRYKK